jgi:hypothetical protein
MDASAIDWVIKILGAVGGLIGTGFGIYNFSVARRKEKQEAQAKLQEEKDRQMYAAFRAELERSGGNALTADPTSAPELFWWAERMVAKGLLERGVGSHYYTLPRGY